jgi:serine/threonine protein kinase
VRLIYSAGRCRERVGVHAQPSYGTRRLERGTTSSTSRRTSVHSDYQANILVNRSCRACLADFGLSTIIGIEHRAAANASLVSVASKISLMSFTAGGTTRWMSPELLDPERFGIRDCRPTKQSDCYAFGVVIYEVRTDVIDSDLRNAGLTGCQVLCGNAPFWEITNEGAVINAIMNGDRPPKPEAAESLGFTRGLWGIVQRCWLVDASARPDARDLLSHLNHATWSWERRRLV